MKVSSMFPSKWLAADDFPKDTIGTIAETTLETVEDEKEKKELPVVWFDEFEKGLILNRTNAGIIEDLTGQDDTDGWTGQRVTLYATETDYRGKMVPCVRIRIKQPVARSTKKKSQRSNESKRPPRRGKHGKSPRD